MSLLMAAGHPEAQQYPIGMLWVEVQIVEERENALEATRASLIHQAIGGSFSQKGLTGFKRVVNSLLGKKPQGFGERQD